ncbi:uncharacterized protein EI97DRAFT_447854 [Westerdykella ornata]|uniref:Ribosomal protein L9 domain-containing protein n=1 Tax=Westerdykella ornata TaxID=318751 RepID=A0A6A6JZ35_WESOR|nr:uncharacterized protein EI97DRAFT_447854 [Westerdykella ornata]KAF2280309.1 hypothetical protein EI97DRAFT_447854 [Westerdykella ornata]
MASLGRTAVLPHCTACTRQMTRLRWGEMPPLQPLQQIRCISKAAKEEERYIVVKLLKDKRRWGRAGSYIRLNPGRMRNRWFPQRIADYVPVTTLKELKAKGVTIGRDPEFGVEHALQEEPEIDPEFLQQKHHVRPVELDFLSPARSMELLTTFVPPTIEFARQRIEQDKVDTGRRYGTSDAADILTAAAMASKPKPLTNAIYGSVSTADVVAVVKSALAHNDEAARVVLSDSDVRFLDPSAEGDGSRVKQLGSFKVEIKVPGAEAPIVRTVRVRERKPDE